MPLDLLAEERPGQHNMQQRCEVAEARVRAPRPPRAPVSCSKHAGMSHYIIENLYLFLFVYLKTHFIQNAFNPSIGLQDRN